MGRPKKPKDQHASKFMVRLPESYRQLVEALSRKNRRPYTLEVQIALDMYAKAEGMEPPKP